MNIHLGVNEDLAHAFFSDLSELCHGYGVTMNFSKDPQVSQDERVIVEKHFKPLQPKLERAMLK